MATMRYRLGAAIAAVSLLALVGCGSDDTKESEGKSSPKSGASQSPTSAPLVDPATSQAAADFCDNQDVSSFTGPAAEEFGAEKVRAAYCKLVEIQYENLNPALLRRPTAEGITPAEASQLSSLRDYMTPAAQKDWDKQVDAAAAGTSKNPGLWTFAYAHVTLTDFKYWPEDSDHPLILGTKVSPATTKVDRSDGTKRLTVEFKFNTIVNVMKNDEPYLMTGIKNLRFSLVPDSGNPDFPWLIDGWNSKFTGKDPVPNKTDTY